MKDHLTYPSKFTYEVAGMSLPAEDQTQGLMSALQHPVPILTTRLQTQPWTGF